MKKSLEMKEFKIIRKYYPGGAHMLHFWALLFIHFDKTFALKRLFVVVALTGDICLFFVLFGDYFFKWIYWCFRNVNVKDVCENVRWNCNKKCPGSVPLPYSGWNIRPTIDFVFRFLHNCVHARKPHNSKPSGKYSALAEEKFSFSVG